MDYGSSYADQRLKILDIKLKRVYAQAEKELEEKLEQFYEKKKKKNTLLLKKLKDGDITPQQYKDWLAGQAFMEQQWKNKVEQSTALLLNANQEALAIIRGEQLNVFAENANYQAYQLEKDFNGAVSFNIYDKKTVENLVKNKPELLPPRRIKGKKDRAWNQGIIANCVTQGIIQGESIDKIAKRIARDTSSKDMKAMRRYARTAVGSAQNMGRLEMLQRATEMGIRVQKQWLATLDGKTRDSHRKLDGQTIEINRLFEGEFSKLRCPHDPNADPAEVYNCRCTMVYVYPDYQKYDTDQNWRESQTIDGQSYEEWKQGKKAKKEKESKKSDHEESEKTIDGMLADAYEYHRTANNLTSVPYDPNSGLKFITSNVDMLDEQGQETIREALGDLTRKYDSPITQIGMFDKNDALFNRDAFAYTVHNYGTDTCKIMINPVKCKDSGKMVTRLKELRESGYCAFVPDSKLGRYVIDHEFGHSLISLKNVNTLLDKGNFVNVDYKRLKGIRKKVVTIFDEYREEIGKLEKIRKAEELKFIMNDDAIAGKKARQIISEVKKIKISNYSLKDPDEFFAEAFVYTEHGGTDNKYANLVREIINAEFVR